MMKKITRRSFLSICGAAAAAAALTACGGAASSTAASSAAASASSTAALSGNVATGGSTSMKNVIAALTEGFAELEPDVTISYDPTGSGAGITGAADKTLDIETIAKIYTGEITNWSEVGGADAEIVLVGREAGSGTRSGFEELTETVDKCKYRQELTSTGDVITAVAQNPDAIGYASLASVRDSVKALKVAGVTPSEETVKDGTYLIQRPFVLVTKEGVELSPVAQAFFDYATKGQANDIITASGVVPANG